MLVMMVFYIHLINVLWCWVSVSKMYYYQEYLGQIQVNVASAS